MNENEIMNEEIEVEETNVENVVPETQENGSGGVIGKLIIGVGGAAVAVAALYKNRHKIVEWNDDRRIKKLEKKGYKVYKDETESEVVDVMDEVVEITEE